MLIAAFAHAQRFGREFGFNYVYSDPMGGMGVIIDRGHGGTVNFGLVTEDRRFSFGLDMSLSQYARDKSNQEYVFDDGSTANMEVVVTNMFGTIMPYARWYLTSEKLFRPFLSAKAGYTWYNTQLNIYDPDDWDHCEPVEEDVLYRDGTFAASVGVGVKADFSSVFKKITPGKFFLEGSFQLTQGGRVSYMNSNADKAFHSNAPDADHVMAKFINTETKVIHEHHVGYLYRSDVQMTELRIGFSMVLWRDGGGDLVE